MVGRSTPADLALPDSLFRSLSRPPPGPSLSLRSDTAQLLLIVSDGRGLFLEGKDRVTAAVQAARNANVFVIFVVLDNPNSRVRTTRLYETKLKRCGVVGWGRNPS